MVYRHDVLQCVFQPLKGIYIVFFADGKKGIDHRRSLCSFMASCEQLIFAANSNFLRQGFDLFITLLQEMVATGNNL